MKILHIASIGRIYEGIGTVINHLYQEQINLGHDVRIISKRQNLLYTNLPISTITSTRDFESFISEWIPDIVIFHSHFHVEFVRFSKILSIKHIPYCVQLHGALSKENYRKGFLKKFFGGKIFFNSVLKNASSIIYLNESEYNNSVVPYINPKRCIIPNGCEDSDNAVITPNKRDNINLTFIGRINYYHKGLDVLINALKIIDTIDNPKFHINFYGNENDVDVERLKQDLTSISHGSYMGGVYGDNKVKVLLDTDIFILTSRYEGMPMGVIEAWSYGIPCILSDGTNMINSDTLENSYWKVSLDPKLLATSIISSIREYRQNPQIFRQAAFLESKKNSWKNIGEATINIYNKIIKG